MRIFSYRNKRAFKRTLLIAGGAALLLLALCMTVLLAACGGRRLSRMHMPRTSPANRAESRKKPDVLCRMDAPSLWKQPEKKQLSAYRK